MFAYKQRSVHLIANSKRLDAMTGVRVHNIIMSLGNLNVSTR